MVALCKANDKMFCYPCVQAVRQGSVKLVGKKRDALLVFDNITFVEVGLTNPNVLPPALVHNCR